MEIKFYVSMKFKFLLAITIRLSYNYGMKKLIEWAEQEASRGRKLILFTTVFVYLLITITLLVLSTLGKDLTSFEPIYYSLSGVATIAIGFYTATKPGK